MFRLRVSLPWLLALILCWACEHEPFPAPPNNGIDTTTNPVDTTTNPTDTNNQGNACHPDTIYFERDVMPILSANCAFSGCHDANSANKGVILDSYNNVVSTGDVRAGDLNGSDLYEVITDADPDDRMPPPPASPLSNAEIATIRDWILQGAKNLSCDDCDTSNISFSQDITEIFDISCSSCHSGGNPSAGLSLTTHSEIRSAIQAGQLLPRINHEAGYPPMPPSGIKLDECKLQQIDAWVQAGMPNN